MKLRDFGKAERRRPASRLLVIDPSARVLLFRFAFAQGALAGQQYWATPGGALEGDETFEQAAQRELFEETGFQIVAVGAHVAEREFRLQMPDGQYVLAQERYFVVRAQIPNLSDKNWTDLEREVMQEHRWWSVQEIAESREIIYPEGLGKLLETL